MHSAQDACFFGKSGRQVDAEGNRNLSRSVTSHRGRYSERSRIEGTRAMPSRQRRQARKKSFSFRRGKKTVAKLIERRRRNGKRLLEGYFRRGA